MSPCVVPYRIARRIGTSGATTTHVCSLSRTVKALLAAPVPRVCLVGNGVGCRRPVAQTSLPVHTSLLRGEVAPGSRAGEGETWLAECDAEEYGLRMAKRQNIKAFVKQVVARFHPQRVIL